MDPFRHESVGLHDQGVIYAFRVWALYESRKTWIIRFNAEFVAARKAQRLRRQIQTQRKNKKTCGTIYTVELKTSFRMVPEQLVDVVEGRTHASVFTRR